MESSIRRMFSSELATFNFIRSNDEEVLVFGEKEVVHGATHGLILAEFDGTLGGLEIVDSWESLIHLVIDKFLGNRKLRMVNLASSDILGKLNPSQKKVLLLSHESNRNGFVIVEGTTPSVLEYVKKNNESLTVITATNSHDELLSNNYFIEVLNEGLVRFEKLTDVSYVEQCLLNTIPGGEI